MKITFVLNTIGLSGGVKAVFEVANLLTAHGHQVTIVRPLLPLRLMSKWNHPRKLANEIVTSALEYFRGGKVDWMNVDVPIRFVLTATDSFMPDADIVVATWWETAYPISRLSKSKGSKFFFIQHYETWYGFRDAVDRSYSLGLHNIVNSSWLKNILEQDLKAPVDAVIAHAPDWDHFYWEGKPRVDGEIRVLMPYRIDKWKGVADGLKAVELSRGEGCQIKLIMFGPIRGNDVPEDAEFHFNPSNAELRGLYNTSHIFLFPSRLEGFGMPPMEAMACRAAVVTTNVGAVPEYIIPGKTALVSPPGNPEALAENLVTLVKNPVLRENVAAAGYDYIRQFTWEKATRELERVFMGVL